LCALASIVFFVGGGNILSARADDVVDHGTEASYDSLWVNDLSNVDGDGITMDSNNNVSSLAAYGRVGYNGDYTNIEVKATINFSTTGNTVFRLRANGDIKNNTFTNAGYFFRWYPHGQFDFVKNDTAIISAQWGGLSPATTDKDYNLVFKTVDMQDSSVHVLLIIDDVTFVDYYDTTDPITSGGMFAVNSEGSVLSIKGEGLNPDDAFDLNHVASPFGSSNFPGATIEDNGDITLSSTGYAGVAYAYQSATSHTIKAKVTTGETISKMVFMIGATKLNSHEVNRPDEVSSGADGWGWDNPGYAYYWNPNGQRYFSRGAGYDSSGLLSYAWLGGYAANTQYTIEFGIKQLVNGNIRVHFKINDALVLNYLDTSKTFNFNTIGGAPSSLYTYAEILCVGNMTINPYDAPSVEDTTITTDDLGEAVITNTSTKLDRNGVVESFSNGGVAYYNADRRRGKLD